jgi:lipoprotein-releasing system ATP-binding protein
MTQNSYILEARNLYKSFTRESHNEPLEVLQGISMVLHPGEIASVVGSSGCGKSTLLHLLGGLDHPDSGQVYWEGIDILQYDEEQLASIRNQRVGFVFQFHHLLPEFTALENIMIPSMIRSSERNYSEERAYELLRKFGIEDRAEHRPTQLSGGEQQRVSMARALANNPRIILADEPTGNLDEENTEIILDLLFELREKEGVSIIIVTHEKDISRRTDRVYELSKGIISPAQ